MIDLELILLELVGKAEVHYVHDVGIEESAVTCVLSNGYLHVVYVRRELQLVAQFELVVVFAVEYHLKFLKF